MERYEVRWKSSAERDLRSLDQNVIGRILHRVEALSVTPFPSGCRKLTGTENTYRIRIGAYRVLYQVDRTNNSVLVFYVRHRRDAYRRL